MKIYTKQPIDIASSDNVLIHILQNIAFLSEIAKVIHDLETEICVHDVKPVMFVDSASFLIDIPKNKEDLPYFIYCSSRDGNIKGVLGIGFILFIV